jgi:hypothetical protein
MHGDRDASGDSHVQAWEMEELCLGMGDTGGKCIWAKHAGVEIFAWGQGIQAHTDAHGI